MANMSYAILKGDLMTSRSSGGIEILDLRSPRTNKVSPVYHRRTPEEIIATVIRSTTDGPKKTRILCRSSLNHKQVNRYLKLLIDLGLVIHQSDTNTYRATDKGLTYLRTFEKVSEVRVSMSEQERVLQGLLVTHRGVSSRGC